MKSPLHVSLQCGLLILVMLALTVGGSPNDARATVNCGAASATADADEDRIPDKVECDGFTFSGLDKIFLGWSTVDCASANTPNEDCLNPDVKDLFVVLVYPSTGSILQPISVKFKHLTDPRETCKETKGNTCIKIDGLGVRVHLVEPPDLLSREQRTITFDLPQTAIQIRESLESALVVGKMTTFGSPTVCTTSGCTQFADGIVYTNVIKNQVNGVYGFDNTAVWEAYIRHTLAHEITHALALTLTNSNKDGRHYPAGTGLVLDSNVTYSGSGADAQFNIGEDWDARDLNCHRSVTLDNKGNANCEP